MNLSTIGGTHREHPTVPQAIWLAAVLFALAVAGIAWGQSAPSTPIPASLFNVTYMDGRDYPTTPILDTGGLGKGVGVAWHYLQPSSLCPSSPCDSFSWGSLDNYVNLANSHGVDFFYDFDNTVRWAVADTSTCGTNGNSSDTCTGMVGRLSDWTNYVTNLAQRYDGAHGHGRILIYEMWNEANNPQDWTDTVTNLAILAKEAVRVIRLNDAAQGIHTIIVPPSASSSYLSSFMSAYVAQGGSPSDFDAVSFHAYLGTNSANCGGDPVPCAEQVASVVQSFLSVMASTGLSGKPLFDTEGSWGTDSLTSAQQVAFAARWQLMHWSSGVSRMMWYAMDNATWGNLCTGGPPCTLTAAGIAYNQVYNWMVGATMTSACAIQSGYTWTCALSRPNGYQALVVWNTSGGTTFAPPSQYTQYRDLAGNTDPISGSVTIGIQPILLESLTTVTPTAVLNVTPQSGTAPLTITADSSGSYETGGTIASQTIDFGDGTVITTVSGTHTYNTVGTYTVKLTVTDSTGQTATATKTVTVSAALTPVAVLSVTPQSGTAPLSVTADSSGSYETGGTIASRTIDFGDGTVITTVSGTHTYNTVGTYTVKLTVTDSTGQTATAAKTVTVSAALTPVAVLSVTPQSGTAPLSVTADSSGSYETGGTIASRTIDFGDGTVITTVSGTHTYNTAGTYTVKLTVTDSTGQTATATKTVTVSATTCSASTVDRSITICSPTSGSTVASPVHVLAYATDASGVKFMQIYVDGAKVVQRVHTTTIDTYVKVSSGSHTIMVQCKDNAGAVYTKSVAVIVQ